MEFKEKLKTMREERNLTQQELADTIYVSRSAVAKWESGRGVPNEAALESLSELFGIGREELLTENERRIFRRNRRVCTVAAGFGVVLPALFFVICMLPLFRYGVKPGMWPQVFLPPRGAFEMCGIFLSIVLVAVSVATVTFSVLTAVLPRLFKSPAVAVRNIVIMLLVTFIVALIVVLVAIINSETNSGYGFIFFYPSRAK